MTNQCGDKVVGWGEAFTWQEGSAAPRKIEKSQHLWSLLDMLRLHAAPFLKIMGGIRELEGIMIGNSNDPADRLTIDEWMHKNAEEIESLTVEYGLSAKKEAARFREYLRTDDVKNMLSLRERLRSLRDRITDDFSELALFVVEANDTKLIEPTSPLWGPQVRSGFPGAVFEIDEAAKCIALDRATAAVFHLMRAVEVALKAVCHSLGLDQPKNDNWGSRLREIKLKIDALPKGSERDYFQDVFQRLDAVKDASRNPCMHVESIYPKDEALRIFSLTESLFRKLAARMDEGGQPIV
jgi:HEPN domain-containing protein